MISPRVMRAMAAPVLGHLDPDLLAMMDETREQLRRLFRAPQGSFAFAVSGTGTSGLEAAVANLVQDGTRVLAVVTGYFGDRLAQVCQRVRRSRDAPRGRVGAGVRPGRVREALAREGADLVCVVHAETSTGVRNPVEEIAARRARGRRARPRGRRHVARRPPARDGTLGDRRGVQLHAEVRRRAVGPRARRVRAAGARAPRRAAAASTSTSACSRTTGCAASTTTRSRRRSSTRSTRR